MLTNYIHGSSAILLCYDVTNYDSFQDLEDWLRLIKQTYKKEELPLICVVGNKVDLNHISAVSKDKHNQFVDENDFGSYFVSAKTGDNVERTFFEIAAGLSNVELTTDEINAVKTVVPAPIIIHQNDEEEKESEKKHKPSGGCVVF